MASQPYWASTYARAASPSAAAAARSWSKATLCGRSPPGYRRNAPPAVLEIEPVAAQAGGDECLAHRHGFEHLQPRAAADAQRHDVDLGAGDVRSHVGYAAGHRHVLALCQRRQPRVRLLPYDLEVGLRHSAHQWQHRPCEPDHGIHIRAVIHLTGEDQSGRPHFRPGGTMPGW